MQKIFIADDGTTFFAPQDCIAYELKLRNKPTTVEEVITEFEKACEEERRTDSDLAKYNMNMRGDNGIPLAGDFYAGIVYLRDDGVDVLIKRIRELEEALKKKE